MLLDAKLNESLEPDELDGVLALRSALRHGVDISLYPRQVMICNDANERELAFIHGLPGSSGLGPVTYAQDKRMRRALMEKDKIPIPKGATFTMGRGIQQAKNFARRIGFPIVMKPAIGDNGIETFRNIKGPKAMNRALDHFRKPTEERETFSRAAYGLTELREPGIEDGQITVPPRYMFMVEKLVEGSYVRFLAVGDRVVSAIECDGYPVDRTLRGGREIIDTVHKDTIALALKAAKSLPGLSVAAIDAVIPTPSAPPETQELSFVEFSERPGLWVQAAVKDQLALDHSDTIFTEYARKKSFIINSPTDDLTINFEAHAIPDAKSGAEAMVTASKAAGVEFVIKNVDQLGGSAHGTLKGSSLAISIFVDGLLNDKLEAAPVMLAKLSTK